MTLIMTIFVVPIGVLAALYLEYAKAGPLVSLFVLPLITLLVCLNRLRCLWTGFFCYIVGAGIDDFSIRLVRHLFMERWRTLGILDPCFTHLARGDCGNGRSSCRCARFNASRFLCLWCIQMANHRRIVLPRAMPGIMTGTILAMARGAGEVAPLMLVGAVKLVQTCLLIFQSHRR